MTEDSTRFRNFLSDCEQLKKETRHSFLSDGRQESVAEHTWRASLMVILFGPSFKNEIDHSKLMRMIIVHDLIEIYAGDVARTDQDANAQVRLNKKLREKAAAERIIDMLPSSIGTEIYDLWLEYEENTTKEANLAHGIDKLEAQLQHNEAGIKTWVPEEYHYAFELPNHTYDEPILEKIALIAMDEAKQMISAQLDVSNGVVNSKAP